MRRLLHPPGGWPKIGCVPTAGDCYRFVLSNPHVHVCLTVPSSISRLEDNLEEIRKGPLAEGELAFMR